jgi:hypothetical protein
MLLSLDLGSGPTPAPGYLGVDLFTSDIEGAEVVYADLFSGKPWPFASESVGRLRAWHVIEHIPHDRVVIGATRVRRVVRSFGKAPVTHHETVPQTQDAFFWFFDQAWRVAAPGCRFELAWPHPQSDGADQDPTHCRRVPSSTLNYLSLEGRQALRVHHYPVSCDWVLEDKATEYASGEALSPFTAADDVIDVNAAKRCHGIFHEIQAVLVKKPL